MMGHFFVLINIFLLPASLLMAAPTMNLDPLVTTNMPPSSMTEVEHLQRLSSGLQALDAIAVRRLSARLQFPVETTPTELVPNHSEQSAVDITTWKALNIMCEQYDLLSALWDLPSSGIDASIIATRVMTELLVTSSCEMSELLLKINYPQGNFSLTCTCQEVGRICHDLKTVTFSDDIRAAILGYKRSASEDINVGAWIDQQLTPSSVLPVAYRLINDTRGYYSDPPPTAAM